MKTGTRALMAGAMGAAMLLTVPASAADPAAWLQRQFTTDHREAGATPAVVPVVGSPEPGARSTDGSGHAFAQAWLKRQFAGATLVTARNDGVAGRAGPIDRTDTTTPLSDSWLRHQFTTDHPGAKNPY